MKKLLTMFFVGLFCWMATPAQAQLRYIDEVFSDVMVQDSVIYSLNWSVLLKRLGLGDTMVLPQYMDVYMPMGDTVSDRPVVLIGVTGTFFPAYVNGGFTGERSDSFHVELATTLAKRGYVAAIVQYRRGWQAGSTALEQTRTILHAAYRGIQDMRACVRFFRKTEAEDGNPFKINPDKIAVGGQGTGAYVSYGATYLKEYAQTLLPKFIEFDMMGNGTPFLDTTLFGDPYGIDSAAINRPNWPTYSSDFNVGFGLDGALGDSSWVEAGDPPYIALHSYRNAGAPYDVGDVIAIDGTNGQPFAVIPEGAGGKAVLRRAHRLGNQNVFANAPFLDDISRRAEMLDPDAPGLYTFVTPFTPGDAMCDGVGVPGDTLQEWGATYSWFDSLTGVTIWNIFWADAIALGAQIDGEQAYCRNTRGAPFTAASSALYRDTVYAFLVPRLALGLDLPNNVGVQDLLLDASDIKVFPNPSNDRMRVQFESADAKPIDEIRLMDISGRVVKRYTGLRTNDFEIEKGELSPGLYMLQIQVGEKMGNKKIMFN